MIKVDGKKVLNERILSFGKKVFVVSLVVVALVLILKERSSSQFQLYLLISAAVIYLAWALVYHHLDKSLTLEVYLEYVLTAILALVLLIGVLL